MPRRLSFSPAEKEALLTAERAGAPFLAHRDEHGDLRLVPLNTSELIRIGRTDDNDVVLAGDAEVSRAHAEIRAAGAGWTIFDDGMSRNGTFVNEHRVVRHRRLEDRDVVRVGATSLLFRQPSAASVESTAVTGRRPVPPVTDGERRVLIALCRPLLLGPDPLPTPASNPEIAEELVLSLSGVKSHVRALFAKLGVDDELPPNRKRVELAREALDLGLVSARDL